jgi:hypothetical protein
MALPDREKAFIQECIDIKVRDEAKAAREAQAGG